MLFVRLFDLCLFGFVCSSWCLGRAAACDCGTPGFFFYLFRKRLTKFRITIALPKKFGSKGLIAAVKVTKI